MGLYIIKRYRAGCDGRVKDDWNACLGPAGQLLLPKEVEGRLAPAATGGEPPLGKWPRI